MLKTNGFVDLRIGHGAAGIGDDSVWPSFTDVMTVIVMIFLMTLVVIMVRNFGLSSELLTNISAREAVMLANQDLVQKNTELEASLQSTETERTSLSISLAQALDRIASLAENQLELEANLESVIVARGELEQANVRLQQAQLETSVKVEGLTADTVALIREKSDLEAALQGVEAERASLSESLTEAREQIGLLTGSERELQDEVGLLIAAREELARQKSDLEAALQGVEAERTSLSESLTEAREQIGLLTGSERELQDEVGLLIAAREELARQKSDLEAALQGVEAERTSLSESLTEAREQIGLLTGSERELQDEVGLLIAAREELARQKSDLEAALQGVEAERTSLSESLTEAREQIGLLTESERGLQDELVRLTANELLLTRNIGFLDEALAELKLQSEAEVASLIDERATLEERIYTLSEQLEHLRRLLSRSALENQLLTEEMAQVERINESAAERYTRVTDEILSLKELIEQREVEIASLKASADTASQQYRTLQEEYESLDVQYRKLVRPARSPAGKTVAEVRVVKIAGTLSYSIKRPDDPGLVTVPREQLDSILEDLKNRLGKSLYTRIVIPDNSNLTFNEAWGFTWEILRKYDYYYQ